MRWQQRPGRREQLIRQGGGGYEDNLPDARDPGGDGCHQDGGWVDCGAARDVEARPFDGGYPLPETIAPELPDGVPGKLRLVGLDASSGESEGVGNVGRDFV